MTSAVTAAFRDMAGLKTGKSKDLDWSKKKAPGSTAAAAATAPKEVAAPSAAAPPTLKLKKAKSTFGGKGGRGKGGKNMSRSARAGLQFPVGRISRKLRATLSGRQRLGGGAPVYMAAVLEYLSAEVLELAGNAARDYKKKRIDNRHINMAIREDAELGRLLQDVVIVQGGVRPNIHDALRVKELEAKNKSKKKKNKKSSDGKEVLMSRKKKNKKSKKNKEETPAAAAEAAPEAVSEE